MLRHVVHKPLGWFEVPKRELVQKRLMNVVGEAVYCLCLPCICECVCVTVCMRESARSQVHVRGEGASVCTVQCMYVYIHNV